MTVLSAARTLAGSLCWEEVRDDEGGHQTQQAAPAEVVREGVLRDERLDGRAEQHAEEHPQPQLPHCSSAKRTPARSFVFSETLNPALTCVRVTDAAGRPVTADTGHLAPGRARCSRTRRT